jgi:hypothetical protein
MYYIISLKHTRKGEKCIAFWRPNNQGYCILAALAGQYETPVKDYHDSEDNIPVQIKEVEKLLKPDPFSSGPKRFLILPNTPSNHKILGLEMGKRNLKKSINKTSKI